MSRYQPQNFVGILLSCSCLVALVSAQCEAEIAACAADGTCSTCRHYGTRCTVPDSDQSAWSADLDSDGGCGEPDLWDYGGLNHDGSMPSFDSNGAPGQQVSLNCDTNEVWGYNNDGKICWSNNLCRAQRFCQMDAAAAGTPSSDYLESVATCKAEILDCLADDACFAAVAGGTFDGPMDQNTGSAGYAGSTCESNALCAAYVLCTYPIRGWAYVVGLPPPPPPPVVGQCTGNTDATTDVACTAPKTAIAGAGAGTTEDDCCETPETSPPPAADGSGSSRTVSGVTVLVAVVGAATLM